MAKKTSKITLQGTFTYLDKLITEEDKNGIHVYNFDEILKQFDGHNIKITISEEDLLPEVEE